MAQSVTETWITHGSIKKLTLDWQSAADGSVSYTTTKIIDGLLLRACFVPDSGGTQPTNAYDVTLTTSDCSADLLNALGANLSNAADTSQPITDTGAALDFNCIGVYDKLTLTIANAGDTKGGLVIIYWR